MVLMPALVPVVSSCPVLPCPSLLLLLYLLLSRVVSLLSCQRVPLDFMQVLVRSDAIICDRRK